MRKHFTRLCALGWRMLGDASEAEDVAQEVFLRVWKQAPRWREGEAQLSTWMHRVAINLCTDRLRRRRERPQEDAGLEEMDGAPSAATGVLQRQRARAVEAALAALPERQRVAIVLCHYQELTNIEAAEALEVSVEALESLLARGRRALKAALAGQARDLMGDA